MWLNNPTESRTKLAPHWKGPYRVVQVLDSGGESALTYRIDSPLNPQERSQVVHHDRLKPYTLPPVAPTPPGSPMCSPLSSPRSGSSFVAERDWDGGLPAAEMAERGAGWGSVLPGPSQSRTGRTVRQPAHLQDFVMF